MTDESAVAAVLARTSPRSAPQLRDALRGEGRVSITVADITRVLSSNPQRFVAESSTGPDPLWRIRVASDDHLGAADYPSPASWSGPPLFAWQHEALAAWHARNRRGVIEAVTGTGKTMVGVAAADEEIRNGGQVLVLVPSRDLLYQWQSVLRSVLPSTSRVALVGDGHRHVPGHADLILAVVNSARNTDLRPRRPGGLLIGDECHRFGSETNRLTLQASYPSRLGLSATYARSDDGHVDWLDPYFGGRCFSLGYRRALDDGVIASFVVALIGVSFESAEMEEYRELGLVMAKARAILIGRGVVRSEPIGAFLSDVGHLAAVGGEHAATATSYLASMSERRRLLCETPAKRTALNALGQSLATAERAIVFTQSIAGAEAAAAELRGLGLAAAPLHSGMGQPVRRAVLAALRSGDISVVTAPTVLDEGIDVPAADLAVVLAASQNRRQMVQRMGRILRRKSDGRSARFAIVYVEGTAEDPASGAHEGFLDEIVPLASALQRFPSGTPWPVVTSFLERSR